MSAKLYSRDALLKLVAPASDHMPPPLRLLVEQHHASKRYTDKKKSRWIYSQRLLASSPTRTRNGADQEVTSAGSIEGDLAELIRPAILTDFRVNLLVRTILREHRDRPHL